MTQPSTDKLCALCGQDVSATKRVRDAKGQYYCGPCHAKATANNPNKPSKPDTATVAAPPIPTTPVPANDANEYDLLPVADASPQPSRVRLTAPAKPAATDTTTGAARTSGLVQAGDSRAQILPKNCPNCGMVMIPGRRICMKCHRDVTRMDKLLAMHAGDNLPPPRDEVISNYIGKIVKAGVYLVVIGAVIFMLWGAWLMYHPAGPFDEYPTKRITVIQQYLDNIAQGTDKSYQHAFQLVSFRVRTTNNNQEFVLYKNQYKKMHDDFEKKYGADWPSKAQIAGEIPDDDEETVPYEIKLKEDTYHISTQLQIPTADAVYNSVSRKTVPGPEDGKNRFGIGDLLEYSAHPPPPIKLKPLNPGEAGPSPW